MTDWTPAMIRYEIRSRAGPMVCGYVDDLPCGAVVDVEGLCSSPDLAEFQTEDIHTAISRLLDDMCCEDGSLMRTDEGWVKKSEEEITEIMKSVKAQYHYDNREWYAGCVLMAILGIMWAITHICGTEIGMREFPMEIMGIPMTLYDTLLIDGLLLLIAYRMFGMISQM